MARIDETAAPVAEKSVESRLRSNGLRYLEGVGALGVTAILLTLGPGLGLTTVSPWSFNNPSPTTFGTVAAIWLVV